MSKRTPCLTRKPRDFYPTPPEAVAPLFPHLPPETRFIEPCAGDGALIRALEAEGHICDLATDIAPHADGIIELNALSIAWPAYSLIITNPPWTRSILHRMIDIFPQCWLLFDTDWIWTKQARPYLPKCREIVGVGRIKWIPGSKHVGMDNCCWYRFDADHNAGPRISLTTWSKNAMQLNHENQG